MVLGRFGRPLAITMWDFSWLERRWPGAGYEDWDRALDELKERGYDAVRIDAYPHLVASDAEREWELLPVWNQQIWGSPALNRVAVQPAMNRFIRKCAERNVKVGLSSWFRQDSDDTRMQIKSPEDLAGIWTRTLEGIAEAGLLGNILYVDLCNEWPHPMWTPFLRNSEDPTVARSAADTALTSGRSRTHPEIRRWMAESIAAVRRAYPDLNYCFSFSEEFENWREQDVSFMDLLEPHIWMANMSDFYEKVGYNHEAFDSKGYENLVRNGESLYREDPDHRKGCLRDGIELAAEWSRYSGKPLITTECWSVIDYKDWPLLDWGWVKEMCEFGVEEASKTGRWVALATSNFCGPQFVGMWRDVEWHRRLTDVIHYGPIRSSGDATTAAPGTAGGAGPLPEEGRQGH